MKVTWRVITLTVLVSLALFLAACSTYEVPEVTEDFAKTILEPQAIFPISADYWITPYFGDRQGWKLADYYWETIQFPDLNGDKLGDVCGRTSRGIRCFMNLGGRFDTQTSTVFTNFSNPNGWHTDPAYWKTIKYPDLNGDGRADICGRGIEGMICALNIANGQRFESPKVWFSEFSDRNGWASSPAYGSTIQHPDLNGDGKDDICGRGIDGLRCALSTGTGFTQGSLWTNQYRDLDKWNQHDYYYATIHFADLNGDGKDDVCGRGDKAVWCGISNGNSFYTTRAWTEQYKDAWHWHTNPAYWSTLQLADLNGDGKADICGKGFSGMYCGLSTGYSFTGTNGLHVSNLSDSGGWKQPEYYTSIRVVDVNNDGKADVCARGIAGIHCAHSLSNSSSIAFAPMYLRVDNFRDANGWNSSPAYYQTVQAANVDSSSGFEWCGRGVEGIVCSQY